MLQCRVIYHQGVCFPRFPWSTQRKFCISNKKEGTAFVCTIFLFFILYYICFLIFFDHLIIWHGSLLPCFYFSFSRIKYKHKIKRDEGRRSRKNKNYIDRRITSLPIKFELWWFIVKRKIIVVILQHASTYSC